MVVKSPEQNSEEAASAISSMHECPPVELGAGGEEGTWPHRFMTRRSQVTGWRAGKLTVL